MKQVLFKIVLMGGLALLLLHFTLVVIYAYPLSDTKTRKDYLAYAYVYPFFHQNWNLFAPAPDANYSLLVQYKDHGVVKTADVFKEVLARHQANRLAGLEPLVIAFSNTIHYFEKNTGLQQTLNGPVKNDLNFSMLERMAKNYLQYSRPAAGQLTGFYLVVENTHTNARRIYFN